MWILNSPVNFVKFPIGSKRSPLLAVAVVSVIAILLAVSIFIVKRSSAHGVTPTKKEQKGCCGDMTATSRRMIGTYYTTENGFQSTIVLNNKGPNQIMVTPILHSQNGQTFIASSVAVGGHSSSEVDLNLLALIAGLQFRSGSFEFTYEGRMLEMGGGLRIVNVEKSLIYDEQMLEPGMKSPSSRLEAVYAVPFEDSQVSVIVTNTTAQPVIVNGDAIFAKANGHHPIRSALGPYETQVVNLPHGLVKKASAGAVSLNHNGAKGSLLAMVHLQDADRGYSESVNFTNPAGGKTTERQGAGLRLGSVNNDQLKAVIAVRNIGDNATTVTATIPYLKQNGDTGTISLPQISLAPGEIKLLNTANQQLMRNDFATAGLEIKYTGAPGSVIATASSVSRSGNHVFALPMKDPKGGLSSTGGYPWFINETSSTVVFIKNTTNEPQYFHLDLVYANGERWGSNLRLLAPQQTFALDVRKIRDSQEKGIKGNILPPDATVGHVFWSVRGNPKTLIGRAQTVDFRNGLASTYECQCTCGMTFESAEFNILGDASFPGETMQVIVRETDKDCYSQQQSSYDVPAGQVFYNTDDSNVATIDSFGLFTAEAPGATNVHASWDTVGTVHVEASGECWVEPRREELTFWWEVQCTIPTGENTTFGGWDLLGTKGQWFAILTPNTAGKWGGRKIYEEDVVGPPVPGDTCWFQGSDHPKFDHVTNPPTWFWTVRSTNEWGADTIGYSREAVRFYRGFTNPAKVPCGTSFEQLMLINCGTEKRLYARSFIGAGIGATTVSSTRAGQTETHNWQ